MNFLVIFGGLPTWQTFRARPLLLQLLNTKSTFLTRDGAYRWPERLLRGRKILSNRRLCVMAENYESPKP
jgi:hypothetical protein